MKLTSHSFAPAAAVLHDPETASDIATIHPTGTHATTQGRAARLAACWNACHGLDLPDDIPAGAVAALVDAARATVASMTDRGPKIGHWRLDAALAPFTPAPDPEQVSPPGPRQWGIFRKAVKTGLGDMPESLITFAVTEDEATANFASLLRQSDIYYMRELRPDELQPVTS